MALEHVPLERMAHAPLVVIRGAGDLASGVAYRLAQAGLPVLMTEIEKPLAVRTTVSFASAVPYLTVCIEGVFARRIALDDLAATPHPDSLPEKIQALYAENTIPIVVDPDGVCIERLRPAVVVDARLAKHQQDTHIGQAPLVFALGPGFTAGVDCHAVVETNRGHNLGRVYWQGLAEANTGLPSLVNGRSQDRVLRAPADGLMMQFVVIGRTAREGDILATVGDTPVVAPFDGVVRGLIDDDTFVTTGMKIGDLDPRAKRQHCFTISDKSLAVGGGVLEAVLSIPWARRQLMAHVATIAHTRKSIDHMHKGE